MEDLLGWGCVTSGVEKLVASLLLPGFGPFGKISVALCCREDGFVCRLESFVYGCVDGMGVFPGGGTCIYSWAVNLRLGLWAFGMGWGGRSAAEILFVDMASSFFRPVTRTLPR